MALDDLGVDYIEGGWPSSNPKDASFFREIKEYSMKNSRIAAFSSTRLKDMRAEKDPNLNSIIDSGATVGVLFGKSWTLHVDHVLKAERQENLDIIAESVEYLKSHGLEVIFDAEHFYQGYCEDPNYAMDAIRTAASSGSKTVVLCDTNGGTLPNMVYEITKNVCDSAPLNIGVHMHNDSGCAVANSIQGILAGARHVQGTINGIGERTGNADLVQIIPTSMLKLGFKTSISEIRKLKELSLLFYETSGISPNPGQPFVGENAFSHKAGIHADAVIKNPKAYEHMDPMIVGNKRRIIISEVSGSGSLMPYVEKLGVRIEKKDPRIKKALATIKDLENAGYNFDLAPASAMLIIGECLGLLKEKIMPDYWKVISEGSMSVAVVKSGDSIETAEGDGPVNAVDNALRKAFEREHGWIRGISLVDYKVILPGRVSSTASRVRVTIELSDGRESWRTMGTSTNIIEASVSAILDGLNYHRMLTNIAKRTIPVPLYLQRKEKNISDRFK